MRASLALVGLLLVVAPPAQAIELGDVQLVSTPDEALRGHIPLHDAGGVASGALDAAIAGDREQIRAGINPSALPPGLDLQRPADAPDRLRVSTAAPTRLAEPGASLAFVVRLRWPEGQLLRRYRIDNNAGRLETSPASRARFGPIRAGDTLYSLAEQLRPRAVTNNQMMLSLLAENPASFSANNVNALKRGTYLSVPRGEALRFPDEDTATERVRIQARTWRDAGEPTDDAGSVSPSPDAASASSDPSPAPRLQLLPPDPRRIGSMATAGEASLQAALEPLETQLDRLESSHSALNRQNRTLQATLERLEADLARLEAQQTPSPAPSPNPSPAPAETLSADQVVAWLQAQLRAALADPLATLRRPGMQTGLAVTAAVLLLILLALRRRRRANAATSMPSGWRPASGRVDQHVDPAEGSVGEPQARPLDDGPDDPLEQASERIAHGRLEAAQAVLDEALGEAPDSIDLRVKLLDVLAMRSDRAGFESEAHVLRAQLDDPRDERWQRVVQQGQALSPDHPLFRS